jgi:predicted PhzF superfamily epimerase YddE/YHI9
MGTVTGRIIDAFGPRPLTGTPVVIFDGTLVDDPGALAAVATAVAMPAVAVDRSGTISLTCQVPPGWTTDAPTVIMAVAAYLADSEDLPTELHLDGRGYPIDTDAQGQVAVRVSQPTIQRIDLSPEDVTAALGLGIDQVAPVADRAPAAVAAGPTSRLIIPVTFLSALAQIAVDTTALRKLCDDHGADAVFCYTFDTLTQQAAVHGRQVPVQQAYPRASALGAVDCIAILRSVGALGGSTEPAVVEQGDHWGRPSRMFIDTSDGSSIGGQTHLSGELTLEAAVPTDVILE